MDNYSAHLPKAVIQPSLSNIDLFFSAKKFDKKLNCSTENIFFKEQLLLLNILLKHNSELLTPLWFH